MLGLGFWLALKSCSCCGINHESPDSPSFPTVAEGVPDEFQGLLFRKDDHERVSPLFPERNRLTFLELSSNQYNGLLWAGQQFPWFPFTCMCLKECQGSCKKEWRIEVSLSSPRFPDGAARRRWGLLDFCW